MTKEISCMECVVGRFKEDLCEEKICKRFSRKGSSEDFEEMLLKADRPTGWIPCSERLPDIGDTFLVTVMVGAKVKTDVASSFGSYIDGFWDTFNDWIEDEECHVIAWMPLPEPYREDGEA